MRRKPSRPRVQAGRPVSMMCSATISGQAASALPRPDYIDLALSAQVRPLTHMPQRGSSFSAPGEGAGGCTSRSSLQSLGLRAAGFQTGGDARIGP